MKQVVFLFVILFVATSAIAQQSVVEISDLRVNEPILGQSVSAGYLTFSNSSEEAVTLLGVEANFANRVEMHQTMNMNGMNQMRPLPSVVIEPGNSVIFEPGGRHLMIMGVDKTEDGTAELTFYFENDLVITQSVSWVAW